jgi:hypothetical protein
MNFPGYLCAEDIMLVLANLGIRTSITESRELSLLIGPEKNGRIYQQDLQNFMGRTCRSFGELIAILERDIFKVLFNAYRKYRNAVQANVSEDRINDEKDIYTNMIKEIVSIIAAQMSDSSNGSIKSLDHTVSLSQLKSGVEVAMRGIHFYF